MPENTGLTGGLGAGIEACGTLIRADGRQVHHARHALLNGDARDAGRALGLDGVEIVAPLAIERAHAVDHRIGPRHHRPHARVVADIAEDRLHLARHPVGLDMHRLVGPPHRDPHAPALGGQPAGDVTADEP